MGNLRGRRLYLHVQNPQLAQHLEQVVVMHGGTVEKFLSKEVNCIIVGDQPPKRMMPSAAKHCSRGRALLLEAIKSNDTSLDPFQFASKWGIDCVTAHDFLRFHFRPAGGVPVIDNMQTTSMHSKPPVPRFLQPPCIKFEDLCTSFKPHVMEFNRFPNIFELHPPTVSRPVEKSKKAKLPPKEVDHTKGFCEWCNVNYDSLNMHIKSTKHSKRISEAKEFRDLDEVISTLPSVSDLLANLEPTEEKVVRGERKRGLPETKAVPVKAEPACSFSAVSSPNSVPTFHLSEFLLDNDKAEEKERAAVNAPNRSTVPAIQPVYPNMYTGYSNYPQQYYPAGFLPAFHGQLHPSLYTSPNASIFGSPFQYPQFQSPAMLPFAAGSSSMAQQTLAYQQQQQLPSHSSWPSLVANNPAPASTATVTPNQSCPSLVQMAATSELPPQAAIDADLPSQPPGAISFDIGSTLGLLSEPKMPSEPDKDTPLNTPPHRTDDVPYSLNNSLRISSVTCSVNEGCESNKTQPQNSMQLSELLPMLDLAKESSDKNHDKEKEEETQTKQDEKETSKRKRKTWIITHFKDLKYIIRRVTRSPKKRKRVPASDSSISPVIS